jgi:hypothetical protein
MSLQPQDVAIGTPEHLRRFRMLLKRKKATDFFHGQLFNSVC